MNRPLVIILGVPGSGKGTQGRKIAETFGMAYLATGDLVRAVRKRAGTGDAFADQVKERYDRGRPQPDEVIVKILRDTLAALDLNKGIILDSFPISLGQTQELFRIVNDFQLDRPVVLFLQIDEWESVKRISSRKFCPTCSVAFNPGSEAYTKGECPTDKSKLITRADDNFRIVRTRMQEYTARMNHIRQYFQHKGLAVDINGGQSIEQVFEEILTKLKEKGVG
ncbi:nucleoside monophosphate kinase [Candidatus Uhrbacteria bacterium]|nr:nucleoside monophosphate kinase [Candidatus Uhrbacteria bacterium]